MTPGLGCGSDIVNLASDKYKQEESTTNTIQQSPFEVQQHQRAKTAEIQERPLVEEMPFDRSGDFAEPDNLTKKDDVTPDKGADNLL